MRTNVFFKGCPLRCGWCANPESQHPKPELAIFKDRCITCGQFDATCYNLRASQPGETSAAKTNGIFSERVDLCPVEAVHYFGQARTASSVLDDVRRDKPFYDDGGGLTLTGGEPTMQPRFAEALLKMAKLEGISTAIETCGHAPWSTFERLLPYLDSVLFDLKHLDSKIHQDYTGVGNELILTNLRKLASYDIQLMLRIPLIPGFNTSETTLEAMGRFILEDLNANISRLDLLPYHTLGKNKYDALGRSYPWENHRRLTADDIEIFAGIFREMDLLVTVGG